jgi:uncharacterized membrane protein YvbJ
LPYCRICGAKLEENAHFCHKCGTPVVTFPIAPSAPARPKHTNRISPEVIALIAVIVTAVIVSVFVASLFFSINLNQTNNNANQTNVNQLSFNFQGETAKANVLLQNLIGKTIPNKLQLNCGVSG